MATENPPPIQSSARAPNLSGFTHGDDWRGFDEEKSLVWANQARLAAVANWQFSFEYDLGTVQVPTQTDALVPTKLTGSMESWLGIRRRIVPNRTGMLALSFARATILR
jgi:hypothetical protein